MTQQTVLEGAKKLINNMKSAGQAKAKGLAAQPEKAAPAKPAPAAQSQVPPKPVPAAPKQEKPAPVKPKAQEKADEDVKLAVPCVEPLLYDSYEAMITDIINRDRVTNRDALRLCWDLGANVREQRENKRYGDHAVEAMAEDLGMSVSWLYACQKFSANYKWEQVERLFIENKVPPTTACRLAAVKEASIREEIETKLIAHEISAEDIFKEQEKIQRRLNPPQEGVGGEGDDDGGEDTPPPPETGKGGAGAGAGTKGGASASDDATVAAASKVRAFCVKLDAETTLLNRTLDTTASVLQDLDMVDDDAVMEALQARLGETKDVLASLQLKMGSTITQIQKVAI